MIRFLIWVSNLTFLDLGIFHDILVLNVWCVELVDGWAAQYDFGSNKYYYFHTDGTVTWKVPSGVTFGDKVCMSVCMGVHECVCPLRTHRREE